MKKTDFLILLFLTCSIVWMISSCKEKGPCEGVFCNNGGTCLTGTCNCPNGFSGVHCEIEDLCIIQNVDCQNGGICNDGNCECPEGYIGLYCQNFDPAQVQALLNAGISPKELYDAGISLDSIYGKMHEGGLIFYLNTNDGTGMVAAPADQGNSIEWGCLGTEILGADGEALGTGNANTQAIINGCSKALIAARVCSDLFLNHKDDWFLPSKDELNRLWVVLYSNGDSSFQAGFYWSSSEITAHTAWALRHPQGTWGDFNKASNANTMGVRAVRNF